MEIPCYGFYTWDPFDDFGGTNMSAWKDVTLEPTALETTASEASVSFTTGRRSADRNTTNRDTGVSSFQRLKDFWAGPCQRMLDLSAMGGAQAWMLPALIVATCVGGAVYGAALGAWNGAPGIGAAAIKLPVALLITVAVAMILNCAVARGLGLRVGCSQSLRVTLLATAVASVLLGALAAGSWLIGVLFSSVSVAGLSTLLSEAGSRIGVGPLEIAQIPLVGLAGFAGASVLWHALSRFGRCPRQRRRVFVAWLLVLASIGGPVIWVLQPLAGERATGPPLERTARAIAPSLH